MKAYIEKRMRPSWASRNVWCAFEVNTGDVIQLSGTTKHTRSSMCPGATRPAKFVELADMREFLRGHNIEVVAKPEPKPQPTPNLIAEALKGHFEHIAYKDHVRVYTDQGFIDVYPVKGGVIHTTFREGFDDIGLGWLRIKWLLRSKGLDVE